MDSIAMLGTNALSALPVLMRFVNDTNEMVAFMAVETIGKIGAGKPEGLKALREIMKMPNPIYGNLPGAAFEQLRSFGKDCLPDVIPALDTEYFWGAYMILLSVAPEELTNHIVLQYAAKHLVSDDFEERHDAAILLQSAGQVAHGEKPNSFGQLNMEPVFRAATNTLRLLAPELLKDHADSPVPH